MASVNSTIDASSKLSIDFNAITGLFKLAEEQSRNYLFEYETYELLKHSGAETPPRTNLLTKGSRPSDEELTAMPGDKVVLKIVSPTIIHKTEVGGVKVVAKIPEKIRSAWRRMMYEVPETYAAMIKLNPAHAAESYRGLSGDQLQQSIARDIRGVLMVQFMPPDSQAFGNEMIVGIRNTREFGMVISAGLTRGQRRIVTDEQLIECLSSFMALANYYSPANPKAPYVIEELEINPFAFTDYLMVPLDGMCCFSRPTVLPPARPHQKIGNLLHPETIGIVGVSTSRVNFGRIILNNILANGYPADRIRIIRPGMEEFEGIKCVADLACLDVKPDLFVIAVGSEKVPELVDEIIEKDAAQTVMLIAGGMGENQESKERAAQVMAKIRRAHAAGHGGPVFLGANCLGVISHPGKYDTMFIPDAKLPKQRGDYKRSAAFVSQSGAFMITRLSKRPELDPAYMISVGNQNDLTLGDIVLYLKDSQDIDVIAVYAEGFKDLDGLAFSRAIRQAVITAKDVIFYKAGRTPGGKTATSGHTASLAGDYMVCESCVRQAGGIVASNFTQFEDLLMLSRRLHRKRINGNRLAALSGAGFEAVGMADNIQSEDFTMQMASFSLSTVEKIKAMLTDKRLDRLVEVKNPLDINPGADDDAHILAVKFLAQDPGVDALVVGLDPLSPAMHTLAECETQRYNFKDPGSIAAEIPRLISVLDKPVVGVVDGGRLYAERLRSKNLQVL